MASQDLAGARLLAAGTNRNAIYLCEQAAEKIIRAVLTSEAERAGIGHQLHLMVDKVPDENPIKSQLRAIEHLAAYATTYRYPTSAGRFGVDLASADGPAQNARPIR